ncbi:MAG: capsular biosynthesis protein [Candidatus Cloacimonetes bacterium]|nr:capsular biosynthesis protein [Candidatus Cloacimonadota bacterium]
MIHKIALIIPNNQWFAPYLNLYTDILKKNSINYDVIYWNRDGSEMSTSISYNHVSLSSNSLKRKIIEYIGFFKFARKIIKQKNYNKLIIFGSISSIFLFPTLFQFKRKYIIDFRDLSIEQNVILFQIFQYLSKNSYCNVISSPGFLHYLPKMKYLISHNINFHAIGTDIINNKLFELSKKPIVILTIGGIRDFQSNRDIIFSLANNKDFALYFVGKGPAAKMLEEYVKRNNISNVHFKGYYCKEDEQKIIKECTFLNIYYPKTKLHSSAISNRFYNGILNNKPMIVTSGGIQGDLVSKYNLGIAISDCSNCSELLVKYLNDFKEDLFLKNRNLLLKNYMKDNLEFEKMLLNFSID